jgi:Mce-associated membrane protein
VTVPPRSRTKPGSAARRPKVAGLRQHAHAGAASPDLTDPQLDDGPLDASPVADEDTARAASTAPVATPTTVPADLPEDAPVEPAEPAGADDTATATPATDDDVATSDPAEATGAPDTTTAGTASVEAPADDTAAEETTALPAADAATSTVSAVSTETATQESAEDATTEAEPVAEGVAASTVTAPRPKGRRTTRMTPRADAPTTVRPGRQDEDAAASPTRAARPTRVRGRTPEADGAPHRFERQRAALTRFGGSKALPVTLVAVIVVCLALAGLAFWQGRQAWTSGPVSNQAVVDVGGTAELVGQSRESIEKIFSYDFTRLDDSVEAARSMSTGQFTDRYLSVFDQTIRTPAQQQQLRQTATVQNIGVVSMRDDRATVMALTQFSAQRTTTGQSTNAPGLLRLEMERVDGRWKLAELTPLTANR